MGNRRRKRLNPKYAALPWNIHNEKRLIAQEEAILAYLENELLQMKEKIDERNRAAKEAIEARKKEMIWLAEEAKKQRELAKLKLEEENRKAIAAVKPKATRKKTTRKKTTTVAGKKETPKPKRRTTRKTKVS